MRLEQLRIENFRGFESLTLDFHPEVTVLVGANGSGKTSVLEAIVLVLANALDAQDDEERTPFDDFSTADIRASATKARISLTLEHRGERGDVFGDYSPERDDSGQFSSWSSGFGGDHYFRDPARTFESEPIAAYYDVDRHTRDSTPGSRDAVYRTPRDAWRNAWTAAAGFHEFFQWFREREDIENAERVEDGGFRDPQLHAVRRAIEALLPGYTRPRVRRPRGAVPMELNRPSLVITKDARELSFDQLSGGERVLVALAGDIARRLAIANPKSVDPLTGEGVVLIDEVDLHLHPKWQAEVVPALRRTFPSVQLVVTTHSLVVLGYVPSECVRLLRDFEVYDAPTPTQGREPNALAIELYDIPLRPPAVTAEISRVSQLIYDGHLEQAREGIERLAEELGDHDTDVVRLATALSLEEV